MRDFLLRLFNLEKADFQAAEGWRLRFMSEWPAAIIILASIALVLLVWQVYRRERGTASPAFKLILALLRLTALAVLVLILLLPSVLVGKSELKEACVVIMGDNSESMNLHDRYRDDKLAARLAYATGLTEKPEPPETLDPVVAAKVRAMTRAEIANLVLANPRLNLVQRIAKESKVRQFVFSASISPAPTAGTDAAPAGEQPALPLVILPEGPVTQIGESIRDAVSELRGQRIAAMVVISDWCSNSGLPPVEAARYALDAKSGFPIFTVGVGDPAEQRDVALPGVSANPVAFLNDPLVFNVIIEQSGYDGQVVPLELRLENQVVAARDVTLEPGRKYYTISHSPDKKGVFKYVVSVPPRADEISDKNNSAEHTVTVKDDKVRVLLVAGAPSWEWRYLRNALARDQSVEVSCLLQMSDRDWTMAGGTQLGNFPLNKNELVDGYDAIVMLGAMPEGFSDEQLENVCSFVGDFGGGLIFTAGSVVPVETFSQTPLQKCLPVSLETGSGALGRASESQAFKPRITPEGWAHPLTRLVDDAHQNREVWDNLPGFFWLLPIEKLKPGAQVLAEHPEEKSDRGPLPLLVEQRYGAGKTLFCATDETWRWRFTVGDRYFYRFWRQAVALVAANKMLGNTKRLTLSVARNRYTVGQKVEIEAKLLNEMLRPSGERFLAATLDLPGGATEEVKLALADPSQGIYRGSSVARKVGSHAVWMKPPGADKPESAPFTVSVSTLESESRRLDVETMNAVAAKTAGIACMIDEVDRIPEKIRSESVNVITEHPIEVWDSWGALMLFVTPLAAEWALRKRRLLA